MPVHSFILTSRSAVFRAAVVSACKDHQRVCEVPLPDESAENVSLVFRYLYRPYSGGPSEIANVSEAKTLTAFAHKYKLTELLTQCETYLVLLVNSLLKPESVITWALFAEHHQLKVLLAHCEHYIINCWNSFPQKDKQLSQLSNDSMVRIIDAIAGASAHAARFGGEGQKVRYCNHCRSIALTGSGTCSCPSYVASSSVVQSVSGAALRVCLKQHMPTIQQLIKQQSNTPVVASD